MVSISGTNNSYIDEIIGFSIIIIIFVVFNQVILQNFDVLLLVIIIVVGIVVGGILSAIIANVFRLEVFDTEFDDDTKDIDLSNRSIISINLSGLPELANLQSLNLELNRIEKIDFAPFRKHPTLANLDVSSNKIEVVDLTILKTCKQLQRLDLRDNPIEALEAVDLLHLDSFTELYVDDNTKLTVDGVTISLEQFHEMKEAGMTDVDDFLQTVEH